jgi:hypothetical protein
MDLLSAATGPVTPNRGNPALTLLAVALGVIMAGIDGTIVAVANRAIQSHLHASLAGIQRVSNAHLLAFATFVPAGAHHRPRRRLPPTRAWPRARASRQFLDIGTGIPTADNTHEVARAAAPESRVASDIDRSRRA